MPPTTPAPPRRRARTQPATPATAATTLVALVALALLTSACGGAEGSAAAAERVRLRLGYFPTVTHAPALVGIEDGLFADALGGRVRLETRPFTAGPRAVEALFSSGIDAAYLGANPAINAHAQSDGQAIRVLAGATSGGASLVVRAGIDGPDDLRGARLATPQLGNTQDVALRTWLAAAGLDADTEGGGDVEVLPQDNALTLDAFRTGDIDGAWVPEPWASRLVLEGGGEVLVDERDLWPGGRFASSVLVVRAEYLAEHPDVVADLVAGHVAAVSAATRLPVAAKAATNAGIAAVAGAPLSEAVLDRAWEQIEFTVDPLPEALAAAAEDAAGAGLLEPVDLSGLVEPAFLEAALRGAGPDGSVR